MSRPSPRAGEKRTPVLVDLALQGGGSHGAFTWGVLDRLLGEPWLGIDGISGTSAGALNAAVLVDGHAKGGAAGARTALENFWRRVSEAARFSPLRRGPLDVILGRWTLDSSPIYVAMDLMSRLVSPYDLNPMGKNPLRAILAETINFERRNSSSPQPMSGPAAVTCSRTTLLRRTFYSPPPVCPPCFRLSRLTASPTGTEAILAIPRSRLSFESASHRIPFSFSSIRLNARVRRAPPQRFSTD